MTLHAWSQEDRNTFRAAAQDAWTDFAAGSEQAEALVESHKAFLKQLGLAD